MSLKIFIFKDHTGGSDVIQIPLEQYTDLIQFGGQYTGNPQCELVEASISSDGKRYDVNNACQYCYEIKPADGQDASYTWCQINPGLLNNGYAIGGYFLRWAIEGIPGDSNWKATPVFIGGEDTPFASKIETFGEGAVGLGERCDFELMLNKYGYDTLFIDFTVAKVTKNKLTLLKDSSKYISNPLLAIDSSSGRKYPLAAIDDSTKNFVGYMHA